MNIEEINSYEDIDTYYEAEVPRFIQEILEDRVEALKHCVNYKKEIERLKSIIIEVREYILQHCEIIRDEEKDVDMVGRIEGIPLLEILDKVDKENNNEDN